MAPKAFISYNHKDRQQAEKLAKALREAGVEVTIDEKSMSPGEEIEAFIVDSVGSTDATIPLISKNSLRSPWVAMEIMGAFAAKRFASKKCLPCYLDKDFLAPGFVTEKVGEIDKNIEKLAAERPKRITAKLKSTDIDSELEREQDLRNALPKIVGELKSQKVLDLTDEAFDRGVVDLVAELKRAEPGKRDDDPEGEEERKGREARERREERQRREERAREKERQRQEAREQVEPSVPEATATGEPLKGDGPLPTPPEPSPPWWRANMGTIFLLGFVAIIAAWAAYKIPVLNRIENTVETMAVEFFTAMSEQETGAIEEMVGLPFYLGSDEIEEIGLVRARFSTLFDHARQETEQQSDSGQIRDGAVLSRFLSGQAAIAGYDLPDALDFTTRPELESENEDDRASLLLPSPDLLEDGARVSANIRGLASIRVHLYFSVPDNDVARLRAVVIEQP